MKRTLVILLAIAMLIGTMAPALAAEEKPSFSYWPWWGLADYEEDGYVESYVQDALGIEITSPRIDNHDSEATNLLITQDLPDFSWLPKSYAYMSDQELIRSIPVAMVEEYCPNFMKQFEEYPALWAMCLDPEDDTQFLYLPDETLTWTNMYVYNIYLRYDWIQKLGIELGVNVEEIYPRVYVADKGLSLDVFTEILRKFVNEDPDGNGVADTLGYVKDYTKFLSAFGLVNDIVDDGEGNAVPWYVHPKTKEMLQYLQDIYAEGLIYPEIFTIAWGQDWELVNNNQAGVWASSTNALNSWANNRPPLTLLNNAESEATVLMIPGIADENGVTPSVTGLTPMGDVKLYVRYDVDDEKLANFLKFLEYTIYSEDPQTIATLTYGEEGVDWEWNEDKTTPVLLAGDPNRFVGGGLYNYNFGEVGLMWKWISYEPIFEAGEKYWIASAGGLWNKDMVYPYKQDVFNETRAAEISNEYGADWTSTRDNYFLNVITGKANLEGDWDAFIEALNDLEFQDYLEELNKAPTAEEIINKYADK